MSSAIDDYKKAQNGDDLAFNNWIEHKLPSFGRLAFQLGVSVSELPTFQRLCLLEFQKQLYQIEQNKAEVRLHQLMVEQLYQQKARAGNKEEPNVLGFTEDMELHRELQNLEIDQRIAIVFLYFHTASLSTTSGFIEKTEHQIEELVIAGMQILQEKLNLDQLQLKQRLSMLEKSYQRFTPPVPLAQENDNSTIEVALEKSKSSPISQPVRKKTSFILGAAFLFLATVVGVSFAMNEQPIDSGKSTEQQQPETITDEKLAEWREQYEDIKKTSPGRLGISAEQYEKLDYVERADEEMELVFSKEKVNSLKNNPLEMEATVNRLLRKIETPQGMVEALSRHSMLAAETEEFLIDYSVKTDELRRYVDELLIKYQSELKGIVVMEQLSSEKLMAQSHNYPEEVHLVAKALAEYNLMIIPHPNKERFRAIRSVNPLYGQNLINSDPYAFQYLSWLAGDPYMDDSGFLWSLEQVTEQLLSMEQALLEEGIDSSLFDAVDVAYQQVFWQLVKGSENTMIFDENGTVKLEYRDAWNRIASSNPMAYIILPILKEMEASNWTASKSYDELEFHHLSDAVDMEKSGELANKLPNGNLAIEDELVDMKDFNYSRIKDLYNSFKTSYDLQLLAGVPPLDVLFMYHYANHIKDPKTQWYLIADSPFKPTLETYVQEWQPIPELTEKARWVELSAESFKQRIKEKVYIYPQVNMDEFEERMDLLLVTEKDRIWQIDYRHFENYDLLDANQQFVQRVENLYQAFAIDYEQKHLENAKPGEIAGVFFKAVEHQDIPTVKQLMPGLDMTDEELLSYFEMYNLRPLSELAQLTFKTHFAPFVSTGHEGSVEIEYEMNTHEGLFQQHFFMEKTNKGWRMTAMNNY
ncbi:hypothetical protein GPDM_01575 [Planococcus donghaensis MPA1U2]|uniref:Uncharacterized protein n=1 Tax=Planococcus donghaensis MPA1U2 TaxID=933115 RepID=E7RCZ2_9BACL|nr:hypothetical protein [Planococcus donghaensis]EGA91136.1 hypothetical protein GPDM_01575 [Planococcus donghaensis MPA1U2]